MRLFGSAFLKQPFPQSASIERMSVVCMKSSHGAVTDRRSTDTGSLLTRMGSPTSKGIPQQMQESRGACFKALRIVSEIPAFSKAENVMLPFKCRVEKREEQGPSIMDSMRFSLL
jgi:hypothetical protein